jgi:branched-chain amino acid transport system substrate-binding protein
MLSRLPLLLSALGVAPLLASCSLVVGESETCDSDLQCVSALGFGSVCQADNYCSEPPPPPARCSRTFPDDLFDQPGEYADYILLGSLFSYEAHNDTLQAAELAVRQVNQNGGLEGRRFAMVHCNYEAEAGDNLDDIQAVEALAPYLAETLGAPVIVGPRGSSRTEATFNAVRDLDTVVISPSATSPALTALDGGSGTDAAPGLLWRTAPPDSLQSRVIASTMRDSGVENVAVFFQQGAYGDALATLFRTDFIDRGGSRVESYPFEAGADFSTSIATVSELIGDGEIDEVLFISSDKADYVSFLRSATATDALRTQYVDNLGAEDRGIFFADAAYSADVLVDTVGNAEAIYPKIRGTRPAPAEGALFDAFAAAYVTTYVEDSTGSAYTPHAYDAAWLSIYGIAWASFNEDEITGTTVARGLRKMSAGNALDITPATWTSVVNEFRSGSSVDVRGASGNLDYDTTTEETTAPIETWSIIADPDEESGYGFERVALTEP